MGKEAQVIESGKAVMGLEFGSTRIKAVLIDEDYKVIAQGNHDWENRLKNGIWTYSEDDIWEGLRSAYADLARDVKEKYGVVLKKVASMGFSAMMHGYLAFGREDNLLVPFRTWRNSITGQAAEETTNAFQYNIPERWSIAHIYQAILNKEPHVKHVKFCTTLAGFVHWKVTGEKVLGIGDASGMFPIDPKTKDYDKAKIAIFNNLLEEHKVPWKLEDILPKVLVAGEPAGCLTAEGAALIDPTGNLEAGIPLCPPEGDAGTGMVATNSVAKRTGNISAGTSIFGMVVLERELKKVHRELDLVTTPDGSLVAMVHANNCTSDINAWVDIFEEFTEAMGIEADKGKLFEVLFNKAMEGDTDCGGLLAYGHLSGENIMGTSEGRPMIVRSPESNFTLANFMRANISTAFAALKIGMDILVNEENVGIDSVLGHGGIFKTEGVAQSILAAAINADVSVMEGAGEGGPWGMALLAAYMNEKEEGEKLQTYLSNKVFANAKKTTVAPKLADVKGFEEFTKRYAEGISIEKAAIENLLQ